MSRIEDPALLRLFPPALNALTQLGQKSVLPAGAILFVEGQNPRGVFVCAGKVNLSTTSRGGKILILKTVGPGEALGLSSTISDLNYETTAETTTPCHVNFLERKHFLEIFQEHPEVGLHTAQCLSRDYQSAQRDIHDLVLTRSSSGKLARLLLSQAVREGHDADAGCRPTPMTHEEMAMRIGASRETVTRLISSLRRRRLIRLDGPTPVIKESHGIGGSGRVSPSPPESGALLPTLSGIFGKGSRLTGVFVYTGMLIKGLLDTAERVRNAHAVAPAKTAIFRQELDGANSEPEEFPKPFSLCAADRDLSLLLVVHS